MLDYYCVRFLKKLCTTTPKKSIEHVYLQVCKQGLQPTSEEANFFMIR